MSRLSLRVRVPSGPVRGVVLVLHGGQSRNLVATSPWQLAVLRMVPFAWGLRRAGARRGLVVARLRYRVRGWNGPDQSPVRDAQEALEELTHRFPGVPVALVGHSMGARTALYVADNPAVRVIVGLAPWIEDGDAGRTVPGLVGRRVLLVHGELDRVTDPRASAAYARAAARVAASVSYELMPRGTHAMLDRPSAWHKIATDFVLHALLRDGGSWPCDGAEQAGRAEEA